MKSNSSKSAVKPKISQIVPSIILESLTIEGDIYGDGGLEIEGRVRGNIRCLSIKIGENAIVHGDITAEKVEIYGEVLGNITAKKIICGAAAKVRGNILHSIIHIENGAHIDGSCRKFVPPSIVYEPEILLENQENLIIAEELSPESPALQDELEYQGA